MRILYVILLTMLFTACNEADKKIPETEPETTIHAVDSIIELTANTTAYYYYLSETDISLDLKIYTPKNWTYGANLPCMVYYHGGAENFSQYMKQCQYLSARGLVAVTVNHRFHNTYLYNKNGLKDGHTAWRWLVRYSTELGIDSTRMAAGGSSAGATVALSCYLSPTFNHENDDLSIGTNPALFVLTNPYFIDFMKLPVDAHDHPPTLFFQGDDDDLTPLSKIIEYCNAVKDAGAPEANIKIYPGRGHGFFNYSVSPDDFFDTLYSTDSFLVDKGYLDSKPN